VQTCLFFAVAKHYNRDISKRYGRSSSKRGKPGHKIVEFAKEMDFAGKI
jgi:hypothetical protein